jgi:hypothetical protein
MRRQASWLLAQSKQQWKQQLKVTQHHSFTSRVPKSHVSTALVRSSLKHPLAIHVGSVSYFSSRFPGGGRGNNQWLRGGAGLIGAGALLLGKGKYLIGALKLTKLASLGSMFLTIGTYSMFFGIPYAAGMVGLIA